MAQHITTGRTFLRAIPLVSMHPLRALSMQRGPCELHSIVQGVGTILGGVVPHKLATP